MRKVTEPFQIKNRDGFYIRWYEKGKAKHKQFNSKKEAEHFRHIQYMRLNNDVYTMVDLPFEQAKEEYLQTYDIRGLSKQSKKITNTVLTNFYDVCRPQTTKHLTQKLFDYYILSRKNVSAWTVNKDIGRLKAFVNWLTKSGYTQAKIEFYPLKTMRPRSNALSDDQIKALIKACPSNEWRLRVLIGLCTGLRKIDLYRLKTTDIDLKNGTIQATERKTCKRYTNYLPDKLIPIVEAHVAGNEYFFNVINSRWLDRQFRQFRPGGITIQSLRKTFATRIETTSISTAILNHSSKELTRKFYSDLDYIKYIRVNQLPIDEWLK